MEPTKLSKYFNINEAQASAYAKMYDIDNTLPAVYYKNAIDLAVNVLDPIRVKFGRFTPLSWYRGADVNKGVGGSKTSDHMIAAAADIHIHGVENIDLARWIRNSLVFKQLILEPSWVHVSYKDGANNMDVLFATKEGIERVDPKKDFPC